MIQEGKTCSGLACQAAPWRLPAYAVEYCRIYLVAMSTLRLRLADCHGGCITGDTANVHTGWPASPPLPTSPHRPHHTPATGRKQAGIFLQGRRVDAVGL